MAATRRALVLGSTGTVGRDVVRELVARGVHVRAATRDPARARALWPDLDPGALEVVRLDLEDPSTWAAAVDDRDGLFLLRPPEVARVGRALLPLVDAALAAGTSRVAFLSVQGAGRNRLLPHHAVEQHLVRTGCGWTSLRAGYFLQNLLTVHRAEIRDHDEIAVPAGRGRTAFVDTRDVAEAAALALTHPGEEHVRRAYELTGPEACTYEDVARVLTEVLGRPVRYVSTGPVEHWRRSRALRRPPGLALAMLVLYTTARLGLAAHLSPELEQVLGRRPRDLRQFAEDSAGAWARP